MCYSAMVEQRAKSLGIRFTARIQLDLFEDLFRRRLEDVHIRIPKGMESGFLEPATAEEERIRNLILAYRKQEATRLDAERTRLQDRLSAAERSLALRSTKKASEEQRISRNKLRWVQTKLEDLQRERPEPRDSRVFPQWFAPVVASVEGERIVLPMRYQIRPRGKPVTYDNRFPGLYNARLDNLTGYWRRQFGAQHGVMVVTSFFENVARSDFEHRPMAPGEEPQNLVIRFTPTGQAGSPPDLTVACLWDHWIAPEQADLWSFAAITGEPPAEIRSAGHDRCIVALRSEHLEPWLAPAAHRDRELLELLTDPEPLIYVPQRAERE